MPAKFVVLNEVNETYCLCDTEKEIQDYLSNLYEDEVEHVLVFSTNKLYTIETTHKLKEVK